MGKKVPISPYMFAQNLARRSFRVYLYCPPEKRSPKTSRKEAFVTQKTVNMGLFDLIVEQKIREGYRNGDFDDLEGTGEPIDLNKYAGIPADKRMAYSIMMNNGIVPEEVQLMKTISQLKEARKQADSSSEREQIDKELMKKSLRLRLLIERAKLRDK